MSCHGAKCQDHDDEIVLRPYVERGCCSIFHQFSPLSEHRVETKPNSTFQCPKGHEFLTKISRNQLNIFWGKCQNFYAN